MKEREIVIRIRQREFRKENSNSYKAYLYDPDRNLEIGEEICQQDVSFATRSKGDFPALADEIDMRRRFLNNLVRSRMFELFEAALKKEGNLLMLLDDVDDSRRMTVAEIEVDILRRLAEPPRYNKIEHEEES